VLAVVAPGQGSQAPGLLNAWLDLPGVRESVGAAGEAVGLDLLRLGTTAGDDELVATEVTQPLVVATALAVARAAGLHADVVAGHSVGEYAAAALAGVIDDATAVRLVGVRGKAMAAASALVPTGMSAVLGGDAAEVAAAVEAQGLSIANFNANGQVVAAGPLEALAALGATPPTKTRVVPLKVAGAFHTHFMEPAVADVSAAVNAVTAAEPQVPLLSNADGAVVTSGAEALRRLVRQIAAPVRWDRCSDTLARLGVTHLVELAPAGTLAALAKRALPGVQVVALKTPSDLDVLAGVA